MATVLITGTSKGIGFETALAFARAGHKVLATMRNPSGAPSLAARAAAENLPITISQLDVDSDTSVSNGIARLVAEHGEIDILVNNAGIAIVGSIEETPLSVFRSIMETNYFGVIRCVQALVPSMRARRSGCIINISSVAGRFTCPPFAPYSASKWALEAMTETLAGELKTFNVRVLLVEPGIIDTAMAQGISEVAGESSYLQSARFAAVFANSLKTPVPPSLVAGRIFDLAQSDIWTMRHLVGPDAEPLVGWRRSMTDEAWRDLHGGDDETFFTSLG
jgi:NAD(P)-dependent dehydrogenase (short-subunit alcohol dehydrogenase family)